MSEDKPKKRSKLILARHGESEFNAKGIWTGHLDPELSPKGEGHAKAIGKVLKQHDVHHAYTSDLKRSQKTWDIAHHEATDGKKHIPTKSHTNLRERDYGSFNGKNKWQVKEEVGDEEFARIRRSWDYAVPEGESLKAVYDRAIPFYLDEIKPLLDQGENVIAVTHGNTNRALMKHLEDISDDKVAELEMPHEVVVIYHFEDGKLVEKEIVEVEPEKPLYQQIIASDQQVWQRINEMAKELIGQYENKNPLFVCLLRGGAPFATKLMFAITHQNPTFHPEMDYVTIKTYGDQRTDRPPELLADILPSTSAKGRPVILLDDVLDKGVTAAFATKHFLENHAASSVELVVLAEKDRERTAYGSAALSGFTVPDDWLTGMGLDDASLGKEANRWAGYIAIANH